MTSKQLNNTVTPFACLVRRKHRLGCTRYVSREQN
jgi:hypothetical protein